MGLHNWFQRHLDEARIHAALDGLTEEQSEAVLEVLVAVAAANGHIAPDERDRVRKLALELRSLKLRPGETLEDAIERIHRRWMILPVMDLPEAAERAALRIPRGEPAQAVFQMVAAVCFADTAADLYETSVAVRVARALGISDEQVWKLFETLGPTSR
jgi:tellurite resistance protein